MGLLVNLAHSLTVFTNELEIARYALIAFTIAIYSMLLMCLATTLYDAYRESDYCFEWLVHYGKRSTAANTHRTIDTDKSARSIDNFELYTHIDIEPTINRLLTPAKRAATLSSELSEIRIDPQPKPKPKPKTKPKPPKRDKHTMALFAKPFQHVPPISIPSLSQTQRAVVKRERSKQAVKIDNRKRGLDLGAPVSRSSCSQSERITML